MGARVVEARDGQHGEAGAEGCECGGDEAEREKAVNEAFGAPRPDPGGACCGDGEEGRHGVDDESPFFVRLKAVEEDEENIGEKDVARWLAEGADGDGKGNADVVD